MTAGHFPYSMRSGGENQRVGAFEEADRLVTDADFGEGTEACLKLAEQGRISAYDAAFILVADRLGLPLVSADRRLAKAFPGRAVSPEEFAAVR